MVRITEWISQSPFVERKAWLYGAMLWLGAGPRRFPFSSQNTYWVHAVANAELVGLRRDWLVQTADPTPVFTTLMSTGLFVAGWLFPYLASFLFAVVYGTALAEVVALVRGPQDQASRTLLRALVVVMHSCGFRALDVIVGTDISALLTEGFAEQYIFTPFLLPSTFGVLFVVSLYAYARGALIAAAVLAGFAALVHPIYVPCMIVLVAAYVYHASSFWSHRMGCCWMVSVGVAFLLATVFSVWLEVRDQTLLESEAITILTEVRMVDHTHPQLDITAVLRAVLMIWGCFRLRWTVIGRPVIWLTVYALGGWAVIEWIDRPELRLLMPWRGSIVVVPIASLMLLQQLVTQVDARLWVTRLAIGATVLGICPMLIGHRARTSHDCIQLVRGAADEIETLLVDPRRGDIRIRTGIPIYVDWKSHPYWPSGVHAWQDRLERARIVFDRSRPRALRSEALTQTGASHVLAFDVKPDTDGLGMTQWLGMSGCWLYRVGDESLQMPDIKTRE